MGISMDLCAEKTFQESWDCIIESNGDLLPMILFAECLWWLIVLLGMRLSFQSVKRWRKRRQIRKEMANKWTDNWSFPPKRNN